MGRNPKTFSSTLAVLAIGALAAGAVALSSVSAWAFSGTVVSQAAAAKPAQAAPQPAAAGGQRTVSAQEAFALVSQEAGKGQAEAMQALASMYDQGLGTARNHTKALEWYQKAAAANLPAAVYQIGLAYEIGRGVTASRDKAMEYFQKAVTLKVPEASYKLASMAMAGVPPKPNEKQALEELKAAGLNNAKAMEALGNFYENGVGLAPNFTQAFNWYQKAADAGLAEAYFRVGTCYEVGLGTPVDPQKAVANFQKASDMKMAGAAYKLAGMYMAGSFVKADTKKALDYMVIAANNGHGAAANELGVVHLQGMLDQPVNIDEALKMFNRSADLGNIEAMKNIAVFYKNGVGGRKPDPAQSLKWYIIAQKAGYQADGLEGLMGEIKKELKPDQIKKSEAEADKWIADFTAKRQAPKKS